MKSSCSSTDSPVSHHPPTLDSPRPTLQPHPPTTLTSQRLDHSSADTSHYEDLDCLATDWLPSDSDAVTWATVTETGAHLTLPQSGTEFFLLYSTAVLDIVVWRHLASRNVALTVLKIVFSYNSRNLVQALLVSAAFFIRPNIVNILILITTVSKTNLCPKE